MPWSWQRPVASVASTTICVSRCRRNGFGNWTSALPFGAASASCWRPVTAGRDAGTRRRRVAGDVRAGRPRRPRSSARRSSGRRCSHLPRACPRRVGDARAVKKSRSVCGFPVGSSRRAPIRRSRRRRSCWSRAARPRRTRAARGRARAPPRYPRRRARRARRCSPPIGSHASAHTRWRENLHPFAY